MLSVTPAQWRTSEAYLLGCDLYNHAYWWEAHEAWEGLWRVVPNPSRQRRFLQGLIQVSAASLKLRMGHLRGVRELLTRSRGHLQPTLDQMSDDTTRYMGLAVRPWWQSVCVYFGFEESNEPTRTAHDPTQFPYIMLDDTG